MEREDGQVAVVASGRAVIDTRAPFKSVKEAVALFGERVLVGELYAKHLQEVPSEGGEVTNGTSNYRTLAQELEDTKQRLEQALEENDAMANTLESLKLELKQAKDLLTKYQAQEDTNKTTEIEVEEVKYIENPNGLRAIESQAEEKEEMIEKMKNMKLASPHSLTRAMAASCEKEKVHNTRKKKHKKMEHPLVGWFIGKKSNSQSYRSSKEDVILSAYK